MKILKWSLIIFLAVIISVAILITISDNVPIYSTDSDFHLIKELPSKDNKHKIISYNFDTGALGYSRVFWAIVPKDYSKFNLRNHHLPDGYKAIGWTEKNYVIISEWEPYYYIERSRDLKDDEIINGIRIKLKN